MTAANVLVRIVPAEAWLLGDRRVLRVVPSVRPWRTAAVRKARAVLELAAGEAARVGMQTGTVLRLEMDDERQ